MASEMGDEIIRVGVFRFLTERTNGGDDLIHWSALQKECVIAGERITLIGAHGIWKPSQLQLPISITTSPKRSGRPAPYDDTMGDDGLLAYKYHGTDPNHRDNVGLRNAMNGQVGLVYFHGISRGWYQATWPIYIIEDHQVSCMCVQC